MHDMHAIREDMQLRKNDLSELRYFRSALNTAGAGLYHCSAHLARSLQGGSAPRECDRTWQFQLCRWLCAGGDCGGKQGSAARQDAPRLARCGQRRLLLPVRCQDTVVMHHSEVAS